MTFLVLNMASTQLILQQSDLEFQDMTVSQEYNNIEQQISDRSQQLGSTSTTSTTSSSSDTVDNDPELEELHAQEQIYDSKRTTIEAQLKVIQSELDNYQKAVETNIKSECKLNIST